MQIIIENVERIGAPDDTKYTCVYLDHPESLKGECPQRCVFVPSGACLMVQDDGTVIVEE